MLIKDFADFQKRYQFDLSSPIAAGGFGDVYKAYDKEAGIYVAIKKSPVSASNKYTLLKEVKLAQDLSHPNVIKYFDGWRLNTNIGEIDFAVMEYANGGDLNQFLKGFPSTDTINTVLRGILYGIDYLHQKKVIHRDLKPSNILLHKEQNSLIPKIIDFGISKTMSAEETALSAVIGSFEYMAPEQLGQSGDNIRPNVDFWSFGIILYQVFTGELPFGSRVDGDTSGTIITNIIRAKLPGHIASIEEPYRSMIYHCLIKNQDQRVSSAEILLQYLEGKNIPFRHPSVISKMPAIIPAAPIERFAAWLIDSFLTIIMLISGAFLFGVFFASEYTITLLTLLPIFIFNLFKEGGRKAFGLGKRFTRLQVMKYRQGEVCGMGRAFLKNLIFTIFSFSVILALVDIIVLIADREHRSLVEMITGVQVIKQHSSKTEQQYH